MRRLIPRSSKYQMTLCQRPSVLRKTLPFVVSLFCGLVGGSSLQLFSSTTNTTLEGAAMSSPMLRTGRRKISPPFGGFTPADGRGYFYGPILCLAAQILRWPWLGIGAEKRGGSGGSPPHKVHGGQPGALLALPKAGNCHDPHSDTVRNGSGLGKFGTYDPRFDAKARNLTPNFCDFDPLQKSLNDRLCRAK